jgi:hypothetical protein
MVTGPLQTARGHQEPFAKQFSVFLENRVGQFKDLLDMLSAEGLTVLGVSVVDSTDWAVLRIVVSEPDRGRAVFQRRRLAHTESRVLLAVLDSDQALTDICALLLQAEINVHFAYPLICRHEGHPVLVLHVDDTVLAADILTRHDVKLLGDEDLGDRR